MIKLPDIELPDKNIEPRELVDYAIHKGFKVEVDEVSFEVRLVGDKVTEVYLQNPIINRYSKIYVEGNRKQKVRFASLFYLVDAPIVVLSHMLSILTLGISIFLSGNIAGFSLIGIVAILVTLADYGWRNHKMTGVTKPLWTYKKCMIGIPLTVLWWSIIYRAVIIIEI